jgi:hypothetical protein
MPKPTGTRTPKHDDAESVKSYYKILLERLIFVYLILHALDDTMFVP